MRITKARWGVKAAGGWPNEGHGVGGEEALPFPCWRLPGVLPPCPLGSVNGNAAGRAVLPRELGNPGHLARPARRVLGVL